MTSGGSPAEALAAALRPFRFRDGAGFGREVMGEDEFAGSGPLGDAPDLGDIGMERGHPVKGGAGEAVPPKVAEVGNMVDEESAPWARAIRSSFTVVSPENTTEPSVVSKRYARAGTARPCETATAVTRTTPSSKTTTGSWVMPSVRAGTWMSDSPHERARVRHAGVQRHEVEVVGVASEEVIDQVRRARRG